MTGGPAPGVASSPSGVRPPRPGRSRRLAVVADASMFVFGIVAALLGAVMPALSERLSVSLAEVGTLFLVMNAAMLASSLGLGVAIDRFGFRLPLAAGAWLVAGAVVAITRASTVAGLWVPLACLGLGGMALNSGANTLVADLHDDQQRKASALNLLGVFYGVGALMLPFGLGASVSALGVTGMLLVAAALCALLGAGALVLRFPVPKQRQGWPLSQLPFFLRKRTVLLLGFLLFFESGNEFMLGGYFGTYLTRDLGASVSGASYLLAAYWGAIVLGRLVFSRLSLRAEGHAVLCAAACASAAGALMVALACTPAAAVAGIIVTGLALAGIFPTALAIAGARFREHSGTVFGILFTVALTGGMTLPWLAGQLAQAWSQRWVFGLVSADFVGIVLLALSSRTAASSARA
jgi:FHS family glucose/mannose:H+ symporter-like MFS transporter